MIQVRCVFVLLPLRVAGPLQHTQGQRTGDSKGGVECVRVDQQKKAHECLGDEAGGVGNHGAHAECPGSRGDVKDESTNRVASRARGVHVVLVVGEVSRASLAVAIVRTVDGRRPDEMTTTR